MPLPEATAKQGTHFRKGADFRRGAQILCRQALLAKAFRWKRRVLEIGKRLYKSGHLANWHTGSRQPYRSRQKTTFTDARNRTQLCCSPASRPHRLAAAAGVGATPLLEAGGGLLSEALAYPKRCPITSVRTLKFPAGFEPTVSNSSVKFRWHCGHK
ncbi:MAG: hypothetical protein KME26_11730 [Oscillatoria princeps RMCB-10]|nr:hypothetical protein [Oscillatoria princeps RMCB-10]